MCNALSHPNRLIHMNIKHDKNDIHTHICICMYINQFLNEGWFWGLDVMIDKNISK